MDIKRMWNKTRDVAKAAAAEVNTVGIAPAPEVDGVIRIRIGVNTDGVTWDGRVMKIHGQTQATNPDGRRVQAVGVGGRAVIPLQQIAAVRYQPVMRNLHVMTTAGREYHLMTGTKRAEEMADAITEAMANV